ncbi:MAG TPA: carboxylesterase family protein [Burkholderiaceae bacterium]|nr:carboxylesterase family protein [Burkholderiaceae bacterium]
MALSIRKGLLAPAFALAALAGCGGDSDPTQVRQTNYGKVEGVNDQANRILSWKGIPFARPPVGDLRWKAPVEPEPWSGRLASQEFGNACIQNGRIYGPGANNTYDETIADTLNTPVGSEDCLTLNIWRPDNGQQNLPVIFFIYGGSNISGYTADPVYDGANLAKAANAVVVTANYRVGVFGFFNLPQLKSGTDSASDSGNFALLDSIQALEFVQANIDEFGGDPGNVTVMGQSAGAINTWALLTSPLADGLMHKAIPLSGGISLASNLPAGSLPTLAPEATYELQGNALLNNLLVADGTVPDLASAPAWVASRTPEQIADYMRSKDAGTILGIVLGRLSAAGLGGSGPIPDGTVLPADPIAEIGAGNYPKMPILAGMTRDEGKLFAPFLTLFGGPPGMIISDADRFRLMMNFDPDAPTTLTNADILHPFYLPVDTPDTGYNARTALLGRIFMEANRDNVMNTVRSQQRNVWYYQFEWDEQPAPWSDIYGAAHAFDLPFVFGNFGPSLFSNAANSEANRPGREALSTAMIDSIAAFVRNGDPNHPGLGVSWAPWPAQLIFDASPTATTITTR